jgi:hypothetical protein
MSSIIYHNHHIIPKHMGGTDDPSNLIKLTVEEHANAHKLLWEEHGRWQDYVAWSGLSKRITSEETIRLAISLTQTGRPKSKETKDKMRQAKLGKKMSNETKEKMRIAGLGNTNSKGVSWSEEAKKRFSEKRTGMKYNKKTA